jgi:hypothetical protein
MRVRLKGINSYKAKLADGTTQTYWYAWKRGPRLQGEPGTPEFIASYNEAVAQRIKPPSGSLFALLQAYQASEDFRQLAPRTQDDYKRIIRKEIEPEFADFPLSGLADRRTRGIFMEWRDKLAIKSRRQADYAWTVLARVLSWSKDRGKITTNPCERGGRVYSGSRAENVWTRRRRQNSSVLLPLICTFRFCLHFGQDSARAICFAFLGLPTTGKRSGFDNPRPAAAWSSPSAPHSRPL